MQRVLLVLTLIVSFALSDTVVVGQQASPTPSPANDRAVIDYLTELGEDVALFESCLAEYESQVAYSSEHGEPPPGGPERYQDLLLTWSDLGEKYADDIMVPEEYEDLHFLWLDVIEPVSAYADAAYEMIWNDGPNVTDRAYTRLNAAFDVYENELRPELRRALRAHDIRISTPTATATSTSSRRTPTPVSSSGRDTFRISGTDVSSPFTLTAGTYQVDTSCTGTAYAVFLTLETAPGESGFVFELLVLGDSPPLSESTVIRIRDRSRVVLVQEVIGDGTASCTVRIEG